MITHSTMYAAVENGTVIAKGSAASMRRLVRSLLKAARLTGYSVQARVWNSPSSKIGDQLGSQQVPSLAGESYDEWPPYGMDQP